MEAIDLSAVLAFVTAVSIGASTVAVKAGLDRVTDDRGRSPIFAAVFVGLVVSVLVFWSAALVRGIPSVSPRAIVPFLTAGVLYPAVFRLLYYAGIDRVGANVSGAIVAANPAIAALLAIPVLDEQFTPPIAVGLVCIIAGGALLQVAQPGDSAAPTDAILRELSGSTARDAAYPVGALLVIGVGYVLIKVGLTGFPHPVTATAITQTSGLVVFTGALLWSGEIRRQLRVTSTNPAGLVIFAGAGVAVAIGWLAQFFALQHGTVVLVVPLLNTYPLVIAAITYLLARQLPRSPRVIVGIVTIVAGASIMQLG